MPRYRVYVIVKEIHGYCAADYKPGDRFVIEHFYIKPVRGVKICLHAMNSILTLLMPFINGISAKALGIGREDNIGYMQCPDPGKPYTNGGTVIFELKREKLSSF